jgi:sugar (pentulose or hexulose) kinase
LLGLHLCYRDIGAIAHLLGGLCLSLRIASSSSRLSPSPTVNSTTAEYCSGLLQSLSLDEAKLPPLLDAAAVLGAVTRSAAAELRLPQLAGVPVVQGAGDLACASLGAGAASHLYVGTR